MEINYKLQIQQKNGQWQDVKDDNGQLLMFKEEAAAREKLQALFPVEVGLEQYAGPKSTRVVVIDPYQDVDEDNEY